MASCSARAANLAAEHANADKMLSKKLVIQFEDSQATPQQGVVAMNKLVSVEKVPFVLSAFTGVSKAIAPIGDKAKVVSVNGGGIGPDLAELGDYFWNVIPLVNLEIRVMAPYVVQERGFKKVALIYVDDPAGEAINKELAENVPKAGGQMVAQLQIPAQRAAVHLDRRESARSRARTSSSLPRSARSRRRSSSSCATTACRSSLRAIRRFPRRRSRSCPKPRARCSRPSRWTGQAAGMSERVAKDWKAKTGKEPNAYVANYYNAVMVFVKLAQAAGKEQPADHRREPAEAAQGERHVRSRRRQDGVSAQRLGVDADPDQRSRRRRRQDGQGRNDGEVACKSHVPATTVLLLQLVINGLQLGAIYALTAVGFSLIFGATKVFHVAHGAAFTIAGYLFWWIIAVLHVRLADRGAGRRSSRPWSSALHGAVRLSADPAA